MYKMLLKLFNINIYMMLCCYMYQPYKAIFRLHLFKDANSLYANHIV
jgi:hypothetical protein